MSRATRTTSIYLSAELDAAIQKARRSKEFMPKGADKPASFSAVVRSILQRKFGIKNSLAA